ncbi:MAG TPA: hypothetical protein VE422_35820 [Terriglobia bacterium]|nr:hypothetical protein [Terriglobia bacterium]
MKERVAKPKGEAGKKPQEAQNAQKGARIFVLLVLFVATSLPFKVLQHPLKRRGMSAFSFGALTNRPLSLLKFNGGIPLTLDQ